MTEISCYPATPEQVMGNRGMHVEPRNAGWQSPRQRITLSFILHSHQPTYC